MGKRIRKFIAIMLAMMMVIPFNNCYSAKAEVADVQVSIEGFQISTAAEGFRTVYSVKQSSNLVEKMGIIYGIESMCTSSEMVPDSDNEIVKICDATNQGIIGVMKAPVSNAMNYIMAMTIEYGKSNSAFLEESLRVKAFALLKDGTYVYSEEYTISIYEVADMLYKKSYMDTEEKHNYLYDEILSVVNSSYEAIPYGTVVEDEIEDEDDGTPKLYVETVTVNAGDSDVAVAVKVKNNPGILGMTLTAEYNEEIMTVTRASNGDALNGVLTLTQSKVPTSGSKYIWDGIEILPSDIQDGDVLVLYFDISSSAPAGEYPITISYNDGDIVDNDLNPIIFTVTNGNMVIN